MQMFQEKEETDNLLVGIDVGSTTTKVSVTDAMNGKELYSSYQRHHAEQVLSVRKILDDLKVRYPSRRIGLILTGSGAKPIADYLNVPFKWFVRYIRDLWAPSVQHF